jgi:hypothetical protein
MARLEMNKGTKVKLIDAVGIPESAGLAQNQIYEVAKRAKDYVILTAKPDFRLNIGRFEIVPPTPKPLPVAKNGKPLAPATDSDLGFTRDWSKATLAEKFNSGKLFTFVRELNKFNSQPGWRPLEIPDFDPIGANMVLHDLTEHIPGAPALPEEEFKAIGAALYMRHEGLYFQMIGQRTDAALGAAFGMLYFHALPAKRETRPCPLVEEAQKPLDETATEMTAIATVLAGRNFCSSHVSTYFPLSAKTAEVEASLKHALGWIRVGYRLAEKRFAGVDKKRWSQAYLSAQNYIESYLKSSSDGDKLSVTVYPEQYRVEVAVSHAAVVQS